MDTIQIEISIGNVKESIEGTPVLITDFYRLAKLSTTAGPIKDIDKFRKNIHKIVDDSIDVIKTQMELKYGKN